MIKFEAQRTELLRLTHVSDCLFVAPVSDRSTPHKCGATFVCSARAHHPSQGTDPDSDFDTDADFDTDTDFDTGPDLSLPEP